MAILTQDDLDKRAQKNPDGAFDAAQFRPAAPATNDPVRSPFAGHTDSQGFFIPDALPRVLRKREWNVLDSNPPNWLEEDFLGNQNGEE